MTQRMTDKIARAAAHDAGDKSMRKAGRTKWNEEDFNIAARTYAELYYNFKAMKGTAP